MKTKDKEALKNLSVVELQTELRQSREKMAGLSFKHATSPLTNPLELRTLRRRIALLETILRQKQAADLRQIQAQSGRWVREEAFRDQLETLAARTPAAA